MATAIFGLLAGISIVSVAGMWAAHNVRVRSRGATPRNKTRGLVEDVIKMNNSEVDGNKTTPEAMKMAAGGDSKNQFPVASVGR
jgi:hypothetical protein